MKKLEDRRIKDLVDKKRQKDQMKANETPEEKRARRVKEKQFKEQKRRERMGWDTEYQHYTNQDNPFGDSHLTSTFVWGKKLEKHGIQNATAEELEVINRQKQLENKNELEKVKKRRLEREMERQQRDEDMSAMQRSREAAQFEEWKRQEDQFHLQQARLRSKIRMEDGRAKPIDLLAQYISEKNLEESIEMQMHEPYTYLNGLEVKDLEDLLADIKVYIELEMGNNDEYWEDLTVIVQDELHKLRKTEIEGRREGIHQTVAKDVAEIFRGKTTTQLDELKIKIEGKISNHTDGVDIGYWESLLSQLKAYMARARLRDKHQEILRQKLEILKQEQIAITGNVKIENDEPSTSQEAGVFAVPMQVDQKNSEDESEEEEEITQEEFMLNESLNLYEQGNYSPIYLSLSDLETGIVVITTEEDEANLDGLRNSVLPKEEEDPYSKEEMAMRKEAVKGMDTDEATFSVEAKIDSQVYLWSDKYRPRKPRYFNRVHTGFEWNKYNQTHYDMDNPPPKIVQGYKFNIFYPDLINKGSTPQYFLVS